MLYFEASQDTVLRRNLGRRIDPETETHYHLDTNRPPYDVVCKERLIVPADPANPSCHLSFQVAAHDVASDELRAFYGRFGTLHTITSDNLTAEGTFAAVNSIVHHQLDERVAKDAAAKASMDEAAAIRAAEGDEVVLPPARAALSDVLATVLARMWDTSSTHFKDGCRKVFRALR